MSDSHRAVSNSVGGRNLECGGRRTHVLHEKGIGSGGGVGVVDALAPEFLQLPQQRALNEGVLALGRATRHSLLDGCGNGLANLSPGFTQSV